jgi:hypothetical protein
VDLQELLQVEEGKNITTGKSEELAELGISVNLATLLEAIGVDVSNNLLTDLNTGHQGASGLAEELKELLTDSGGLNKATGLSVARTGFLSLLGLGSILELLGDGLLKGLVVSAHRRKDASNLLNLGAKISKLGTEGVLSRGNSIGNGGRSLNNRGGSRSRGLNGGSLGLASLLLNNGSGSLDSDGNNGSRGSSSSGLSFTNHFLLYYL